MNILVTGSAGFLGSKIASKCAQDGHNVYGLYHDRNTQYWAAWNTVQGNITDYHRMLELIVNFEIDQVYHCAAKSIVRNCVADPIGCIASNVLGTVTVLEACRQSGRVSGVMCMESDKAYGSSTEPYTEDTPLRPTAIYEASKSCVSHLVATYWTQYRLPVFGVRAANLYGSGDPNRSRLVPNCIDRLFAGKWPQIVEGAENFIREFLYVEDAVTFVTELMKAQPWGKSVNIGSGITMKVCDAVIEICHQFGRGPGWDTLPRKKDFTEIPVQELRCDLLWSLIGKQDVTDFRTGIEKTIKLET